MTTPIQTKDQRIARLFREGYSLNLIAEKGLAGGWTRADALRVASDNGWALDASGCIPRDARPQDAPEQPKPAPVVALPRELAALIEGRKHPVPRIKNHADRIHAQLVKLADELDAADEERKVRERLAEIEAEAAKLRASLRGGRGRPAAAKPSTADKPIAHGTWGGFLAERMRGLEHCGACEQAKDDAMAERRAAKAAKAIA